jgi:hypothetical protein
MPESTRYLAARKRLADASVFEKLEVTGDVQDVPKEMSLSESDSVDKTPTEEQPEEFLNQKAHFSGKTAFCQ